jgi:hypothetical protein
VKITRQHLIDLARNEALKRADLNNVLSAYLIGSVASGDPLLGDTADIDLVLIHQGEAPSQRETVRLSHQVHFDICHHAKDLYMKPNQLRVHPWLGPALCEPIFLHDPNHFFEWAQAGSRGQFFRADHTYTRANAFLKRARQGQSLIVLSQRWLKIYLRSVLEAANAIASLDRFPVAGRRLALALSKQADHFEYPALYQDFFRLIGGNLLSSWDIPNTLAAWARAYDVAAKDVAPSLLPACRRDYYLHGFQAMLEDDQGEAILWPLLQIWDRVMAYMPETDENASHYQTWNAFLKQLKLSEFDKNQRKEMLGGYIDQISSWVKAWGKKAGA